MEIRFDSLGDPRPRTVRFSGLRRVLRVTSLADVLPALEEIDRETAAGRHAAGFVSYEAAPAMDTALVTRPGDSSLPLLLFGIFDERMEEPLSIDAGPRGERGFLESAPRLDADAYAERVRAILDYVGAGDSYQVNFTFPLRGRFKGHPDDLYHDLCLAQRSDYCAMIRFDDTAILSASPELFFERRGEQLRMKPMKGTRPRGRWAAEDDELLEALRASPKDQAENLMIVDLLRNDLGRVARFGTVRVESLYDIERYPTVHQMTSTISAEAAETSGLREVFMALFPSGSVTGAPKVRTCEIIRELEDGPRGVYTGAIGFVSPGEAVFSVAIRTVVLDLTSGAYELGVGSGITADSDPSAEYAECLSKGAFLRTDAPRVGLIESLRLEIPGGIRRTERHLRRMERSARYFGIRLNVSAARAELEGLADGLAPGTYKARLELAEDGGLTSSVEPVPAALPPVTLGIALAPVSSSDRYLYHKTTRREVYVQALAGCPGCDDVILWNERGEVTETTVGNLVVELEGRLFTPPVASGLLPGIMRETLLEEGTLTERPIRLSDLEHCTRLYVINSVREWREATLLNALGAAINPGRS